MSPNQLLQICYSLRPPQTFSQSNGIIKMKKGKDVPALCNDSFIVLFFRYFYTLEKNKRKKGWNINIPTK
ncbi:hypothetical protein CHI02_12320 [Niallia circulans]|nr:hypothetical protein CHH62_17965 [Niallia circulans]PAE11915.1 hypothetical protein CHI02_12320 [Niallia circulans]